MIFVLSVIGGFFRRAWGGWLPMKHWAKILIAFGLGICSGFLHTSNYEAALIYGVIITLAFLNPYHGEGVVQGKRPAIIMGLTYGFYTLLAYGAASYYADDVSASSCINGFLTPIAYQLAWKYKDKITQIKLFGRDFITEPTTIGELALGALLIG